MSEPRILREPGALRQAMDELRRQGRRIGLVPTMGALHEGHMSLVREARRRGADHLLLTIFVNPLQFAEGEDLELYPRTFDEDLERCRAAGVHELFAPAPADLYPPGFQTHVEVGALTRRWEGEHRPDHFRGVTTVVSKLFHLTGPCLAVFGRKDYQQWRVLHRMAEDLNMPVEVIGAPIVREADGLALSSRNRYLSTEQRERALGLSEGLRAAAALFSEGERHPAALRRAALAEIEPRLDSVDYLAIADPESLEPLEVVGDRALVAAAAHLGQTRLIDNMVLGEEPPPPRRIG